MNFKQNSLFKRNTELEEEQEVMQGGVLAVWGSPSSGKTTVSVKLADYLARKKKNVLLIFADMTAPALHLCRRRFGRRKVTREHSCCHPCNGKSD